MCDPPARDATALALDSQYPHHSPLRHLPATPLPPQHRPAIPHEATPGVKVHHSALARADSAEHQLMYILAHPNLPATPWPPRRRPVNPCEAPRGVMAHHRAAVAHAADEGQALHQGTPAGLWPPASNPRGYEPNQP